MCPTDDVALIGSNGCLGMKQSALCMSHQAEDVCAAAQTCAPENVAGQHGDILDSAWAGSDLCESEANRQIGFWQFCTGLNCCCKCREKDFADRKSMVSNRATHSDFEALVSLEAWQLASSPHAQTHVVLWLCEALRVNTHA